MPVPCPLFAGAGLLALVLLLVACGPPRPPLPWQEEDLGTSHHEGVRRGAPERDRGTLVEATARLDAALAGGTEVAVVAAAVDVSVLGGDLTKHRAAIHGAIDRLDEDQLAAAAADADPTRAPAGALALRLALLAHHRGDDGGARQWLAQLAVAADAADPTVATRATALAAETAAVDPAVIAVLLPLSGRFAPLGEQLRAAIDLVPRDGATVVVIDTTGSDAGAAAAVDRAAARGAVAILGPVGERESVAAARRASELGIPIALLAPADGADPEAGVFRLVSSSADEARGAARIAAAESFPTAAVLAPRDDVGQAMADAFVEEATAQGIAIARIGFYDPTASDLEPDIKAFLGLVPATNRRLAAHLRRKGKKGWQTFSPDIDFSLLYLPDAHDKATLVAAFLPYLGVELRTTDFPDLDMLARKHGGRIPQVVQLLGSGGWNHPGLVTRGGDAIEGAMFVDVCAGALDMAGTSGEIAARYREAAGGTEPGTAALQAFDAARIVFAARARGGPGDAADARERVRAELGHGRLDDGACPASEVSADGELERDVIYVEIENSELLLVEF